MRASMKNSKKQATRHRTHVAAFGAALGSLAVGQAAPAEASVVDLTSVVNTNLVEFGGFADAGEIVSLGAAGSFYQFNDTFGKTLNTNGGGIAGFVSARASSNLTSDRFFTGGINFGPSSDGIRTFGFVTDLGQLGWFRLDLGGTGGDVHYIAAAFNDEPGAPIHIGSTPEPATTALLGLSLLAMGARGVRRLREQRKPTGTDATS
jgi:PEP-CTERM motif